MPINSDELYDYLAQLLQPQARGRLLARGLARGLIWRDGKIPDGAPPFGAQLTADLLDYGYGLLAIALELRDVNLAEERERFDLRDAFRVAAESIESAVRHGPSEHPDRGRHLVVAGTAFHISGYAARAYSLVRRQELERNLATVERALALLVRHELQALRLLVSRWLADPRNRDAGVAAALSDPQLPFDESDALATALSARYCRALGLFDSALLYGDQFLMSSATQALDELARDAGQAGMVSFWWTATLTRHLIRDIWGRSLHQLLPPDLPGVLSEQWTELRSGFIQVMATRDPPELDLWPSQIDAVHRMPDMTDDLVVALPTSAGKTRIAELCILRALASDSRIAYITPLRALSAQVETTLARTFGPLGATVTSLYGSAGTTRADADTLADATIVVATPEKFDFAIRQDPDVIADVRLVVLDEGHMIGVGSREVRYEVMIQRLLRRDDASTRRIVCLSAMFNPEDKFFRDFGQWIKSDDERPVVHVNWRPTRQLVATLTWSTGTQAAMLEFLDGERPYVPRYVELAPARKPRRNPFPTNDRELCVAAAQRLSEQHEGILVYSAQRRLVDSLVGDFVKAGKYGYWKPRAPAQDPRFEIASAIAREWLGEDHPAALGLRIGVGAHHGALPPPYRSVVEELLALRKLPVVVASPTLAQGIDLQCGAMLFRSIERFSASQNGLVPISAAEFGNVLGRVGRARVDIDGIAILPLYETATRRRLEPAFQKLIGESKSQLLISGLAQLVYEIASIIATKLQVPQAQLLEFVANNVDLWSRPELGDVDQEGDEEAIERPLSEALPDLDLALLSLLPDLSVDEVQLSSALDGALLGSLWSRTLQHLQEQADRDTQRAVLVSRCSWLWRNTTDAQRQACYHAGLGANPGLFLYERMDALVELLIEYEAALMLGDASRVEKAAAAFGSIMGESEFFVRPRQRDRLSVVLPPWVRGDAAVTIGSDYNTITLLSDVVTFKLVWAAEAVRVQAARKGHSGAALVSDGPALSLEYGVPSREAALLCRSGFHSRTGAVWLHRRLGGQFATPRELDAWIAEHRVEISEPGFWENPDHRLLWNARRRNTFVSWDSWGKHDETVSVQWAGAQPAAGSRVRVLHESGEGWSVHGCDMERIGTAEWRGPFSGYLDAIVDDTGGIRVVTFGPQI